MSPAARRSGRPDRAAVRRRAGGHTVAVQVVLLRHGIAEDRAPRGDDGARRLTAEGREKLAKGARGLARLLDSVDAWAASPLVRAVETARIASAQFQEAEPEELEALLPGARPEALLPWLRRHPAPATLVAAGHAPHLAELAGFLLGANGPLFELDKGGACLLELDGPPKRGAARLGWLLTARQLRRMRR